MPVLVTGAAGFIGYHVAAALLARGDAVIGVDNLDPYYDVGLKRARLAQLEGRPGFQFAELDIAVEGALEALAARHAGIDRIVHLAAQAGVRHSLKHPRAYVRSNLIGHVEILELARHLDGLRHLVYASSSSVYGAGAEVPFSIDQRCDTPVSLYAATKRADELMSYSYSHLYGIKATGLRFFTVYGPWGRPDMAPMLFARAIFDGTPIRLFNDGAMQRDFTYIDDVVAGVLAALDRPPKGNPPHRLFNLGNHRAEKLVRFIETLEQACGRTAIRELAPMQPGDVPTTFADIADSEAELGFAPRISIDEGVPRFLAWFREYYGV